MLSFGERIGILRRRQGMTQRTLGAAAEIHPNTIARLERGRLTDVPGRYVARLARALGTSADYLLGLTEQEETPEAAAPPPQNRHRHAAPVLRTASYPRQFGEGEVSVVTCDSVL